MQNTSVRIIPPKKHSAAAHVNTLRALHCGTSLVQILIVLVHVVLKQIIQMRAVRHYAEAKGEDGNHDASGKTNPRGVEHPGPYGALHVNDVFDKRQRKTECAAGDGEQVLVEIIRRSLNVFNRLLPMFVVQILSALVIAAYALGLALLVHECKITYRGGAILCQRKPGKTRE